MQGFWLSPAVVWIQELLVGPGFGYLAPRASDFFLIPHSTTIYYFFFHPPALPCLNWVDSCPHQAGRRRGKHANPAFYLVYTLTHTQKHTHPLPVPPPSPKNPRQGWTTSRAVPIFKDQLQRKAGICFWRLQSLLAFLCPHPIAPKHGGVCVISVGLFIFRVPSPVCRE